MKKKPNRAQKIVSLAQYLRILAKRPVPFGDLLRLANYILTPKKPIDPILKDINRAEQHHPNYFTKPVDKAMQHPWQILHEEHKRAGIKEE